METHFDIMEESRGEVSGEKIKEDLRTLVRDAEEMIKATAGDLSEKAQNARSRLSDAVQRAKATCHRLEEKTIAAAKATDKVIRDHPYESIGIALGVGMLIGILAARRN